MRVARFFVLASAMAVLAGCSFEASTGDKVSSKVPETTEPTFTDITLTDDENGRAPKTEFTKDTAKLIAYFGVKNMPKDTVIKGAWYCDKSAVTPPNYKIDEAAVKIAADTETGNFSLSKPTNGWPAGEYRLDLSFEEKVLNSIKFKVSE